MNDKIFCTENGFAVKTLFLSPLEKEMGGDHLFNHFSTIGKVRSVRIQANATSSFGFVTFQEAEVAAMALKMKFHIIAGRKVNVAIANNYHLGEPTITEDVPIELANATGTHFLDLNDDCIHKILTYVGLEDLDSLLLTSLRLNIMAFEAYRRTGSLIILERRRRKIKEKNKTNQKCIFMHLHASSSRKALTPEADIMQPHYQTATISHLLKIRSKLPIPIPKRR